MIVEQMYTDCLAEAAYYIESEGEVAVIDPLRDPEPYIEKAGENGAEIKYIFETHFHADFVSGHIDLAKKTSATIIFGPNAKTSFDAHIAKDGEEFNLGSVRIKVLHTPGHTLESSTFLLIDEAGKDYAIFSGDTLFIGDVGRPDLAVKSDLSEKDLAGLLYHSLRNKILPLADKLMVYPAHGAGSSCGKNMSEDTFDTLGHQKKVNYALAQDKTEEEFVKELTEGILPPPQYFLKNAKMNKEGYDDYSNVLKNSFHNLDLMTFQKELEKGALILDTRNEDEYRKEYIKGSINIPLDGMFAVWVGTLIPDLNQKFLLICDSKREEETIMRLARVGYDHSIGFLEGGIETWVADGNPVESIPSINSEGLKEKIDSSDDISVLDVRKPGEYEAEHLNSAINFPLDFISDHFKDLNKDKTYYIHCKSGYRSMIAQSILRKNGFTNLVDITGGFDAIKESSLAVTEFICPSKSKEKSNV
jgi:hydroxyacylglutathione hydrolase